MKNILIIQGGGRPNGNTAQLVEHFARGAKEAGHTVEVISLRKQEVKGCMGCNACRYGKPCVQKDSFNELVPKIKDADCIVFASPLLGAAIRGRGAFRRFKQTIRFHGIEQLWYDCLLYTSDAADD